MSLDLASYLEANHEPVAWNLPIAHWSPSSLSMLIRCPFQWQERYIRGKKERPGEGLALGTAVHAALERNFKQKIGTHEDIGTPELLEEYAEVIYPRTMAEEQEKAGEEIVWDSDPDPMRAYDKARVRGGVMLTAYHETVSPRIQPLSTEGKISVDLGAPVPVEGRFDLERETGVIDFKTGKQKQSKPKEAWRIQAAVYGEATGKPVEFHSISAGLKSSSASVVTPLESEALLVHPSRDERLEMRRSIQTLSAMACMFMALYGPDEPWPTLGRFHTWACDYCGYRAGCPAWKGVS